MKAFEQYEIYKQWATGKGRPIRSYNAFCELRDFYNSETKALIERHKAELEYAKTEGYNLGSQHGQQQGT